MLIMVSGCCRTVRPAVPRGGDARTPAEQDAAAAEVHAVCVTPDSKIRINLGSAVLISETTALTAAHVIQCDGVPAVVLKFSGGERKASVTLVDVRGDIARLTLTEPLTSPGPARFGPTPPVDARVCLATAIPSRGRSCGEIGSYDDPPGDANHDAITEPGNSGSGVYDASGRLVGIVTHFRKCSNGQYCGGAYTTLAGRVWAVR